jgi:hypothetical protein
MCSRIITLAFLLFLAGCATAVERAAQKQQKLAEVRAMSDYQLCSKVRIQDWPPTWRGGKGMYWFFTEADYRRELQSRGVTPFLCSSASKRCVSYGLEFGTKEHRDCTINEGRNVVAANIQAEQRKAEQYRSLFGNGNQNNNGGYLTYEEHVKPYLIDRPNNFCHSGGAYCTD